MFNITARGFGRSADKLYNAVVRFLSRGGSQTDTLVDDAVESIDEVTLESEPKATIGLVDAAQRIVNDQVYIHSEAERIIENIGNIRDTTSGQVGSSYLEQIFKKEVGPLLVNALVETTVPIGNDILRIMNTTGLVHANIGHIPQSSQYID